MAEQRGQSQEQSSSTLQQRGLYRAWQAASEAMLVLPLTQRLSGESLTQDAGWAQPSPPSPPRRALAALSSREPQLSDACHSWCWWGQDALASLLSSCLPDPAIRNTSAEGAACTHQFYHAISKPSRAVLTHPAGTPTELLFQILFIQISWGDTSKKKKTKHQWSNRSLADCFLP